MAGWSGEVLALLAGASAGRQPTGGNLPEASAALELNRLIELQMEGAVG